MKYLKILFILSIVAVQSCLPADEDIVIVPPMTGSVVAPNVHGDEQNMGGTQPNQVWIDLSNVSDSRVNKRTDWDFGFYNGDEFRIIMNGSIAMAAGEISGATNIDNVKQTDVNALMTQVQVGTFTSTNLQFVDNPNGNFLAQTSGIAEVKTNENENPIYLVNMGRGLPTSGTVVAPGSVTLVGDARGWKKVQFIRIANGYKIKYANINDTTHQEFIMTKDPDYNFNFFSIEKGAKVNIHPTKNNWDLGFTTFINEVFLNGVSQGTYFYADYVITNTASGVGVYQVTVSSNLDQEYNNFKLANIDETKFIFNDHRAIGEKWRTTTGDNTTSSAFVHTDRFFVIKDAEGFYFKLRFNKMKNDSGERGHPNFEFEPL